MESNDDALRDACTAWQDGRDGGSSPIRAAARVLTRTPHYFQADFIAKYERDAAASDLTMRRADALLDALESAPHRDVVGWATATGVESGWVGRGIKSGAQDDQIVATLKTGSITMPLWGLSLDREVALSFGDGFLFELTGPFPAIPAWHASKAKADERELIAGGRYAVTAVDEGDTGFLVRLEFIELAARSNLAFGPPPAPPEGPSGRLSSATGECDPAT